MEHNRSRSELIEQVAAAVDQRRGELHERLRDGVEERVPDFRFTDAEADARASRLRDDILDAYLESIRTGDPGDLSFHEELGANMALAGLPLEHHFIAHRVAYPLLLDVVLEQARRAGGDAELDRELIARHLTHASGVTEAYVNGYVSARDIAAVDTERNTTALLSSLVDVRGEWTPLLTSQAAAMGLGPDTPCVGLIMSWGHLDSPMTPEALRRRLNGWVTLAPSRPVLTVAESITGLVGLRSGADVESLSHTLSGAIRRLADDGVFEARCGVSSPRPAHEAHDLLEEAAVALAGTSTSRPVRTLSSLTPFEYLILTSEPSTVRLVDPGVRKLFEFDDPTDPTCVALLDTWYRLDGDLRQTAAALHCHPNTVLNRLRRIADITSLDPRRPRQLVQLVTELAVIRRHRS